MRSSKPTGHTSECPECTAEVIGESRGRDNMEHSLAALSDELSAIRFSIKQLYSCFERFINNGVFGVRSTDFQLEMYDQVAEVLIRRCHYCIF